MTGSPFTSHLSRLSSLVSRLTSLVSRLSSLVSRLSAVESILAPRLRQQFQYQSHRQPHHAKEVPVNSLDQRRAPALDAVGARLVVRLTGGDVVAQKIIRAGP